MEKINNDKKIETKKQVPSMKLISFTAYAVPHICSPLL